MLAKLYCQGFAFQDIEGMHFLKPGVNNTTGYIENALGVV